MKCFLGCRKPKTKSPSPSPRRLEMAPPAHHASLIAPRANSPGTVARHAANNARRAAALQRILNNRQAMINMQILHAIANLNSTLKAPVKRPSRRSPRSMRPRRH